MMNPRDAAAATALIIQGYIHANATNDEKDTLREVLSAIVEECSDWGENVGARFVREDV